MNGPKVYLLDLGTMTLDGYMMFWSHGPGGPYQFPVYGVLIDHPEGKFLFDTGFDKGFVDGVIDNCFQSDRQTIPGQLDLIGIRPSEITHVINSHYHVDHVGGNRHCTHATTICHKCEMEAFSAPAPYEEMGYAFRDITPQPVEAQGSVDIMFTPRHELLSGDQEIAKGLHLFETPGHTPGHYSLMVELSGRRPMLFTGDACYSQRSMEENIISNAHSDVKQTYASMQRLRDLAEKHDAELFYSHDPHNWKTWQPAPGYYS